MEKSCCRLEPAIPIPLLPQEEEPILDLQPLLHWVYQRGRYYLAIDYTQPLQPSLSQADRQWVEVLFNRSI